MKALSLSTPPVRRRRWSRRRLVRSASLQSAGGFHSRVEVMRFRRGSGVGPEKLLGWSYDPAARRQGCRTGFAAGTIHLPLFDHVHGFDSGDVILVLQNNLNPSISRAIRLMARWSYSMMLFRYLFWRIRVSTQASALTLSMAAVLAPHLSMVIFCGTSCRLMARSRKRRAAARSRLVVRRKFAVSP